ncbi:ATP-binding protein [Actinoplanes sp. DH11]|uniref:ATP-binding protein n=1 Tax=Actinoplanes sp. DH11 TaxID=2857011 RepID=UPI001E5A2BBA|nr:ATP-binding protein [Actinoplanes sp. DH11]
MLDDSVIGDTERLAAVHRARRVLPALPIPLDAMAGLAAKLLHAPMAAVTLVGDEEEHFVGVHRLPESLTAQGRAPLAYSVCKYIVSQDHPVFVGDMLTDDTGQLRDHPLATEYGVRAFLGVPVRDSRDRPVGSLTVLGTETRQWTDDDVAALVEIAEVLRPPDARDSTPEIGTLDTEDLLDSAQEAFLAVKPDGVVAGYNRAAEELLGFTADEVCGRHLDHSLLPHYDEQPIGAALDRLFTAAPERQLLREITVRHRAGHRLTVTASLSVVRGTAGALACVFLTDVSEQAAARDLAVRHGSFLAALLDALAVGVIACDDAGQVVVMNQVLRDFQRLPATGPLPTDYPESIDGVLHDAAGQPLSWQQTPLMRAYRGEHVEAEDVLAAMPGDQTRTFATTARPVVAEDGRLLGAVAVAHELTEMRRAERFRACHLAVQQKLSAAATMAEATPGVLEVVGTTLAWPCAELFLLDEVTGDLRPVGHWAADGDDGREVADDFFGHLPRRGYGITGRVWQTEQALWVPDIGNSAELRSPYEKERVRACTRRGIHSVLAVPVRDGGTLLGVLTCYAGTREQHHDLLTVLLDGVAAQIAVYVTLRRAEELARQLTRAQDDFLDLVGHEMRTPLAAITANATMLADDAHTLDGEHQQMVHAIARNTAALEKIVGALLDLAGLDSGHVTLSTSRLDLGELVAAGVAAARHQAAGSGVRLHTDLSADVRLEGDPHRLRQVVDDLLSNAVKYSLLGGDVHIRVTRDADMAELCISDTGIGTPHDEHDRVFDRFFRGNNVRHQGITGSGLGLSLARTIVSLHGGTIRLTENQPSSTMVCVRLPAPPETPPDA